ncbi:MAG TPA: conjugal transfer protein TraF [Halioglobus sp.]
MKPLNLYRSCSHLLGLCLLGATSLAWGSGYGVYDTRTLALGGTGVAMGDINTGHFYNPALTAFHYGHEDRTQDGLHSLQLLVTSLSDGARTATEAIDDDLEGQLTQAIDQLNEAPTPQTARAGIDAAHNLESAMLELRGEYIDMEAQLGYSISLPADREGGAFFIGTRLIGEGQADIQDEDLDLLQDYVEALEFIESNGSQGQPHPVLYDDAGRLIDPSNQTLSTAEGTVALVSEFGLSAAKEFHIWHQPVSWGLSPKAIYLRVFDETWEAADDEIVSNGEDETALYFNLDLGVAATFAEVFRVGLAVKDLRSMSLVTVLGREIILEPRTRLGLAYLGEHWRVGLDADLSKTARLRRNASRQDLSFGLEYQTLKGLQLRAGYSHDLEGSVDDKISVGLGWRLGRFALDLAYSSGSDSQGAGLHLGWAH